MNRDYNHSDTITAEEVNRREFLKLCGLGALSGFLAACQIGPSSLGKATPTPSGSSSPTPSPTRSPTEADWSALARSLQGTLVRPSSSQYSFALQLFDPRFDSVKPAAIAYCASPVDVQNCLAFVRKFGLPLAPRSGGHSYAGYSTMSGLV
ncbi:MAG: FAD-dependent oxidoreductase, partial [Chloroflexota bacterium]|nr:FAD-dependent oxidoreductase [Chloroflexota bacterium]